MALSPMCDCQWLDIDTAPKDRTEVILCEEELVCVGYWLAPTAATLGCWWRIGGYRIEPTHWMPLPDPPARAGSVDPAPPLEPTAREVELFEEIVACCDEIDGGKVDAALYLNEYRQCIEQRMRAAVERPPQELVSLVKGADAKPSPGEGKTTEPSADPGRVLLASLRELIAKWRNRAQVQRERADRLSMSASPFDWEKAECLRSAAAEQDEDADELDALLARDTQE